MNLKKTFASVGNGSRVPETGKRSLPVTTTAFLREAGMKIRRLKGEPLPESGRIRSSGQHFGLKDSQFLRSAGPTQPPHRKSSAAHIDARLLATGADSLLDWEILDLILRLRMTERDTGRLAQILIMRFGCLGGVVGANIQELCTVVGIKPTDLATLKVIQAVALRIVKSKLQDRPVLRDWDRLADYLNSVLSYEGVEHLRVLFLNQRSYLLAEELHSRGTVDHVPVYPREIVKRALELNSSAVILAHNHPSGNPTPSKEDVDLTVKIMGALNTVGIMLHDHIVVSRGSIISFRKLGVVPFAHVDPDAPYHRRQSV